MSSTKRLERVSARTYRIRESDDGTSQPASRFVSNFELPDAAKELNPSRFARWLGYDGTRAAPGYDKAQRAAQD